MPARFADAAAFRALHDPLVAILFPRPDSSASRRADAATDASTNLDMLFKHGPLAEISRRATMGILAPSAPRDRSYGGRPPRCLPRAERPAETATPRPRDGTRVSERVRAMTVRATFPQKPPAFPPFAVSRRHRATRGIRGPGNRTRERSSGGPSRASGLGPRIAFRRRAGPWPSARPRTA